MNEPMRRRRLRFSVATLLLVTTICALSLTVWRIAIYEPPTRKIPLYEKAPGTRGTSIVVRPNTVQIRLLARNDRDGSIHHENGRGLSIPKRAVKN